jgi:glycine oxidase
MCAVKSWEVIIVGGGLIGLSLALALRKQGASVLVVDRGEPGREASHAAAGMLAHCDPHTPALLQPLARASARMYPAFVHELEDESGQHIDFRRQGTILLENTEIDLPCPDAKRLSTVELTELEPGLRAGSACTWYLPETSVDPRSLVAASLKAARHRGVDLSSGLEVTAIEVDKNRVAGVRTTRTHFAAPVVVNCAGAWSGQLVPLNFPVRPIKGQMLATAPPLTYNEQGTPSSPRILQHAVRTPNVYMVPRSDGRIVIGSTLEDTGFDKRIVPATIRALHQQANELVPELVNTRTLESWAGLRPATPDGLPLLGATTIQGYFVATGHYRNGILLAPATAQLMMQLINHTRPDFDISPFRPSRFA